jgi:hypothetical protein
MKMANRPKLNPDAAFGGFLLGLLIGGVMTLLKGPRIGRQEVDAVQQRLKEAQQDVLDRLESITPSDPISENIAEGKEAAQRRRAELGLNSSN